MELTTSVRMGCYYISNLTNANQNMRSHNKLINKEKTNFTASVASGLWGSGPSHIFLKGVRITMTIWENYITILLKLSSSSDQRF